MINAEDGYTSYLALVESWDYVLNHRDYGYEVVIYIVSRLSIVVSVEKIALMK